MEMSCKCAFALFYPPPPPSVYKISKYQILLLLLILSWHLFGWASITVVHFSDDDLMLCAVARLLLLAFAFR
jgi:hypothetical protein